MKAIQFIERDGIREYAIMPMRLFEGIAPLLAELDDEALFDLQDS